MFALPILRPAGYFLLPTNHDVAATLDVSARWIGGEELYVEVIDENLPLTFVVHALPVLTAKVLPGIFASFWACRRVVRLVPSADSVIGGLRSHASSRIVCYGTNVTMPFRALMPISV